MNKINKEFLFTKNKSLSELHFKQPGFNYSA